MALVPYPLRRDLDRLAPTHYEAPTGARHAIRYDGDEPVLAVRVQELFGLAEHPAIAGGRLPLVLELLSPAGRPRPDDARPARLLGGFLARCAGRDARPLSQARLAGRPACRRADHARQAARRVRRWTSAGIRPK